MNEEDTISLLYPRYVELALRHDKYVEIPSSEALVLQNSRFQLTHVELVDIETDKTLKRPRLWLAKEWKTHEARIQRLRKESELRRAASTKQTDNIKRIKEMLMRKYKLPEDSAQLSAIEIATKHGGVEELGPKFDPLTEDEKKSLGSISYMYKI